MPIQTNRFALLAAAAAALLLAGLWPAGPATARGEARVHDPREVEELEFLPRAANREARRAARREGRLAFRARGRSFELDLEENEGLMAALPAQRRQRMRVRHEVYRGGLAGRPDSWVRLTRSGRQWRGLIFDGDELMAMEPGVGAGGSSLYRVRDVAVDGSCALDPDTSALPGMATLVDELDALPPALGAASAQLDVALVADRHFVDGTSDPEGTALAILNSVDGIYADQVGVSLRVVELQLLTQDPGLSSTDAGTLLGELSSYTRSGGVENPGLVHLLTGRNLDGSTIGIAYLNVLCNSRFGVGVSEMLSSSLGATAVLVAHELGHNFGAPHDNQSGSACASSPGGFIMNPFLVSSADSFSACSLDQIAQEVARASCLSEIAEPTLPACSNGIDDDGDGTVDFREDLGCGSPEDPSEAHECADGLDNDDDGRIDFAEDPECVTAEQWSESDPRCGFGFEIAPVVLALMARRRRARTRAA